MSEPKIVTVLRPEDEYTHEPDPVSNYNESMYLNGFDLERELDVWFRIGNRVNEGYAEMTVVSIRPTAGSVSSTGDLKSPAVKLGCSLDS